MAKQLLKPTNDLIFKLIFGDNRNIDILTDFLKSVLNLPEEEYSHITIVDPHLRQTNADDKLGILDVKLHTKSVKIIDIEIQVSDVPQMRERIVYYTSKMITEQMKKGGNYNLKKVISIVITDYQLITENEAYHNVYQLHDLITGSKFTDVIEINTLELPKIPHKSDSTDLWDWMKFLKSEQEEELEMLAKKNPNIQKAVVVLKELSHDERTRLLYEEREKARRDEQARQDGAVELRAISIAKNLLKDNLPIDKVASYTGLPQEEVEVLAKESD